MGLACKILALVLFLTAIFLGCVALYYQDANRWGMMSGLCFLGAAALAYFGACSGDNTAPAEVKTEAKAGQ